MLPEFSEPYHGRPLTFGEIGCFMSHYNIWREIVTRDLDTVLVFEDDIRFEAFFTAKLSSALAELRGPGARGAWDLVYIGRKILHDSVEDWVPGSSQLVTVDYTYWTLAYILSKVKIWVKILDIVLSMQMLQMQQSSKRKIGHIFHFILGLTKR